MEKLTKKQRRQRAKRGWCDGDAWNAGFYLARVGADLVKRMRTRGIGYPTLLDNRDEWELILSEIEGLWVEEYDKAYAKWNHACALLGKWGPSLWD